jgi:ATP-dependent exoDNAse (exonuclease V) beta subunit
MNAGMRVEFVRAGAGSGKTHRLTSILAERLGNGSVRPHAVIATTFTIKAATELRERARAALLRESRLDLAAAIGQSRIGTVNSVCGQLIQRFCFELGMSPEQTVLDEQGADNLRNIALADALAPEAASRLILVSQRLSFSEAEINTIVGKVMENARANNIPHDDIAGMGHANAREMLASWPAPTGDHSSALELALAAAQQELQLAQASRPYTKLERGLEAVVSALNLLRQGRLPWGKWNALTKIDAGAPQRPILAPVIAAAQLHGQHSRFHADVAEFLEAVFDLAGRALQGYADAKLALGVVDFTDQIVKLLEAIRTRDLVREALADELDLVLVDEFQDTDPLQLALFVELAKLSKASVWVGDQKQAIYGFKGTDSELIQQVLAAVGNWGGVVGAPLTESRRSTPALVKLANTVFVPAFAPLSADQIELRPTRARIEDQPDVLHWSFERPTGRKRMEFAAFGPAISDLLNRGFQVQDKKSRQLRPLRPGDIAVLCRSNFAIPQVVHALARWDIPATAERPGLLATPEVLLVLAVLRRLHDTMDTIATATILGLTESLAPESWLSDRLEFLSRIQIDKQGRNVPPRSSWQVEGAVTHPLLLRLERLRDRLLSLTPYEALRLAKAESGVVPLVHRWSSDERAAQVRIANVEGLLQLARRYEDSCLGARQPASVSGLLLWLRQLADAEKDGRAAASHGAVEVTTFHRAKGLEWPVVIVAGLEHRHRSDVWDVRTRTTGAFDASRPLANRFIHYWPKPYGQTWDVIPEVQQAEASPVGLAMDAAALAENTRLLYVTLTRARDLLVLVGDDNPAYRGLRLDWIEEVGGSAQLWTQSGSRMVDGVEIRSERVEWDGMASRRRPPAKSPQPVRFFARGAPVESEVPLWFSPSSAGGEGFSVAQVDEVGSRIPVAAGTDFALLGSAIHACLALANADPATGLNIEDARFVLGRWGVLSAVDPGDVVRQVKAFDAWRLAKWPDTTARAEVPIEGRRGDGTIIRGQIDLLLSVKSGSVLIDHKADPRSMEDRDRLARTHGGQLDAYAEAIHLATSERVTEAWLFLPVAARAVRISGGRLPFADP